MDKVEAKGLLEAAVAELRAKSRVELERLIGSPDAYEVQGKSGKTYQMEKQAFWDDKRARTFVSWYRSMMVAGVPSPRWGTASSWRQMARSLASDDGR